MTRPNKLGTKDTRTFNLVMRSRTLDILSRKSDELTRLTQTQVSVADIIRLCVDMNMEPQDFYTLCEYIIDQNNGFITFSVSVSTLHNILAEVLEIEFTTAPNTRVRKIIFKDGIGLSAVDKLKIVGSVIGRKKNATNFDIYESMLYLHHQRQKITMSKIAGYLNVSERTLYRNMDNDLKVEKKILNEALQQGELFAL